MEGNSGLNLNSDTSSVSSGDVDESPKSKRAVKACLQCQQSHLSCEDARPCMRCVHKNMAESCVDGNQKKRGRKRKNDIEDLRLPTPHVVTNNAPSIGPFAVDLPIAATPEISQFLLFDFLFAPWDHVKKHLAQPDSSWNKPVEHESGRKFLDILTIPFLEFVKQRLPPTDSEALFKSFRHVDPLVQQLQKHLTKEIVEKVGVDFQNELQAAKQSFENFGAPTVVFDKESRVHFVNKAYTQLFGFSWLLPTPVEEYVWLAILSPASLRNWLFLSFKFYIHPRDSYILPIELLAKGDRHTEAVACITIKRDRIGLPAIFIATILPRSISVEPLNVVEERDLNNSALETIAKVTTLLQNMGH